MMTRLCWVVILGVAYTCEAGVNVWTGKGPDSGAVFRVSVSPTNPSTVYACGPVGYRVSTDGGTSWTPLDDAGIDDNARDCFEIVATANALYRCSWGSGCFRSSDGGASWSLISTRVSTGPSVAADSAGQVVLIADYAGVQRSTDSGMTWSKVLNTHSYSVGARMVAFDPSDDSKAYAGNSGGFYKSTDGGQSWSGFSGVNGRRFDFSFDPVSSSCWSGWGEDFAAVFACDAGSLSPPSLLGVTALHFGASAFFGGTNRGIFKTSPDFSSWLQPDPTNALFINSIDSGSDQHVYAGSDGGLLRSTDFGSSWTKHDIGPGAEAYIVAGDAASSRTYYAGTWGGLFKTTNDGQSWEPLASAFGSRAIGDLTSGSVPGTLFVVPYRIGLLRSTDGGATWSSDMPGLPDPGSASNVAASHVNGGSVWALTYSGFYSSTDAGATWTQHALPPFQYTIESFSADPYSDALYIGSQGALTRYTNGGSDYWVVPVDYVRAGAVSPSNPDIMYAGGDCCMARSTDGGTSWSALPYAPHSPFSYVTSIVLDPYDAQRVWISTLTGVYTSRNGGDSWVEASYGLQSSTANTLIVSPANSRKLAVATSQAGGVSVLQYAPPGDVNADGVVDLNDVFALINGLFASGPALGCLADVNVDGKTDAADVFYLINYLYSGGASPQAFFDCGS
jgi:photosystem II stability/assembly factor-like uncharacterized protein